MTSYRSSALLALIVLAGALVALAWLAVGKDEPLSTEHTADSNVAAPVAPPEPSPLTLEGELVQVTTPAEVRSFVAFARTAGHGEVVHLRLLALESDNALVVGNSIRELGRLGAVLRDGELLAMLTDERPRVRQELVRALGESKDPRAVPHLAEFIEGEDPTLRTLAIQSLGKIGGHEARVLLENARSDPRSQGSQLVFLEQALAAYER